jgi:hypothetical protein
MFCVVDREKDFTPVKSGFKTSSQANSWAKKNLPKDEVQLWGENFSLSNGYKRYFVKKK